MNINIVYIKYIYIDLFNFKYYIYIYIYTSTSLHGVSLPGPVVCGHFESGGGAMAHDLRL